MQDNLPNNTFSPECSSHEFTLDVNSKGFSLCSKYFCKFCGIANLNKGAQQIRFYRPVRLGTGCLSYSTPELTLKNLIRRQKVNRPVKSDFVNFSVRLENIELLKQLCRHLETSHSTFFKAVAIMDWTTSSFCYQVTEYKLVALVSFGISCKLNEVATKVPTEHEISELVFGNYSKSEIADWESRVFMGLNWQPDIQTTSDFTEFVLAQGVLSSHDFNQLPSQSLLSLFCDCLDEIVAQFLQMSIAEFRFYRFTPFGIAVSIIACARGMLGLKLWSNELEFITGVGLGSLSACVEVLMSSTQNKLISDRFKKIIYTKFGGFSAPRSTLEFQMAEKRILQLKNKLCFEEKADFQAPNSIAREMDLLDRENCTLSFNSTSHSLNRNEFERMSVAKNYQGSELKCQENSHCSNRPDHALIECSILE